MAAASAGLGLGFREERGCARCVSGHDGERTPCLSPTDRRQAQPLYIYLGEPIIRGGGLCSGQSLRWDPLQQPMVGEPESAPSSSFSLSLKAAPLLPLKGGIPTLFCICIREGRKGCEAKFNGFECPPINVKNNKLAVNGRSSWSCPRKAGPAKTIDRWHPWGGGGRRDL